MKKIFFKNELFFAVAAFFLLLTASCSVGLGEALDLTGPDVTLTSPIMRECVKEDFSIVGTAYDNIGVQKLVVTLDGNEWKNEGGIWYCKNDGSDDYILFDYAVWEKNPDNNTINWKINNVNISIGTKVLTVIAYDAEGNTTSNSKKMVTIIFDNEPPKITIINPNIKHTAPKDIKEQFKSDDCKQLQVVNNVETGGFEVSGVCADDNTVSNVRLYVKKVDANDEAEDFITKNLVLDSAAEIPPDALTSESLRKWTVEITDDDLASLGNGKEYLQISTEATDSAGNTNSGVTVHGYILLWKDADKPWVTVNLGESYGDKTEVYSGATCQGNAFDNVQVKKILLTINKSTDSGNSWSAYNDYKEKEISLDADEDDVVQSSNFSFNYPSETGDYQIVLKAVDDKGNESESVTSYISVKDMTFPSIEIEEIENPFGDANGNFTIKVSAFDDSGVKSVKYKICKNENEKSTYSDKNNTVWNNPDDTKNAPAQSGTVETNGFLRKKYDINYPLNLFDNLSVGMKSGKNKLEQTTFIFLVEDNEGNKSVSKFVLPADITPPTVTLDKIDGNDSDLTILSAFKKDFEISGKWSDDSFDAWKSLDENKAPSLSVKVLEKTLSPEMKADGTWSATVPLANVTEYGSVVGVVSFDISITDIGGSTTQLQKSYQIDTNAPALEYVSCDKPSGTYASGVTMTITLNFNREVTVSGTPALTLSNGQSATYSSGSGTKKLNFTFTTQSGKDTDSLLITGGSLNSASIFATSQNDLIYESLDSDVKKDSNKTMGKTIKILTSIPLYKSHSWNNTSKELTIVFDGFVNAKSGTITITQDESNLLAPAYLEKDEYNNMSSAVQAFYEEGTLGADASFTPNLTTKYILKYAKNTNEADLKAAYIATGSHKTSVNILSENVTSKQDANAKTTTFTIKVGELPCKGANYTFDIPANLVANDAGTGNAKKESLEISSSGIEKPVIRIYKPAQTITGASGSSAGTATHALSTTFKVDCRTPGATMTYGYDCLVATKCAVAIDGKVAWGGTGVDGSQEEWHVTFAYNGTTYYTNTEKSPSYKNMKITPTKNSSYSTASTGYTANSNIDIGKNGSTDIDYKNGLTYKITATATKGSNEETAHEVAYRTTLVLAGYDGIYDGLNKNNTYSYWPYSNNSAVFIRGGDNWEGANSTSGLPTSWNKDETNKILMLTKAGNDFYFTTWNISVDKYYFQPVGGLCDEKTNTVDGVTQGPAYSIFQQDGIIFTRNKYPVGKGEYMEVTQNGRYDLSIPGKVMSHR